MRHVLMVEDDARVSSFLSRGLRAEGYTVAVVERGDVALEAVRQYKPDLLLLDVMLPGMNGIAVCQELRAAQQHLPILMLTAMDALEDKVTGLRCGADDYLTKPFAFEELLARMEVLLRRARAMDAPAAALERKLELSDVVFDLDRMQVFRAGQVLGMTAKELALLELLMRHPGRVFSRERILNTVWGVSEDPLTNVVDVYIRRLRSKIDEGRSVPLIHTLRGLGYCMEAGRAGTH